MTLPVPKTSDAEADQITVATNANIKPQILNCISASKQTIDLELTEISDSDVVAALISAMEKGIQVRLIVGSEQAKGTPNTLENLRASGAQIRYCPSAEPTPLTRCYALFDRQTLIFSSSGWTNAVFVRNHEISVTAPSPQATVRLAQAFSDDWSISSSQLNADQ
ncbi:MAG: phospholipase D family protein [Peptococcaceae bacterium]|nr:phospholipase D family protein [Peptococcaceae bacterium]